MLANAYPNASGKESVYVTNQSIKEVLTYQKFHDEGVVIEKSISVLTALSATSRVSTEELLDYAYRPVDVRSMVFDIYSPTIGWEEAFENYMHVIDQLGNRLIIMDINGDIEDNSIKCIISECDVVLYTFNPSLKDVIKAKEVYDGLDEEDMAKFKFVCTKYNNLGVTKKEVQDILKIRANSILWFPYHQNIERTMFEHRLCVLNKLMIEGRDGCVELRQPIKDILSFICDTPTFKVIKEAGSWVL